MSYNTINACAHDQAFQARVTACAAQEGSENPPSFMTDHIWEVASEAGIEAAYASALAADHENPGGDEAVITDQQILSVVQPLLTP